MKSPLERFKTLAEEQKKSLHNSERKNDDQKLTSQQKDLSEKEASQILLEGDNYLPISSKIQTPVPNIVLRSALFGLVEKGDRKFEKNVLKASFNGYTVKYTGEQLYPINLKMQF